MRTLASIQTIDDIQPIPGADAIEVASILGWKVVVKKGEFYVGDKIVYLEIDSWVPNTIAPFLSKGNEPREFEGVKGERLRTVKLRGQISQGLVLPLGIIPLSYGYGFNAPIGEDVTDILGIKKYEAPVSAALAGQVRGNWPSFLQKTDETRIQAMPKLLDQIRGFTLVAHEKLDGSSMTVYNNEGDFGVCSRNLNLTETDGNAFWQVARKYDLRNALGEGFCIQGELVGPGVQANKYNLTELDLYAFNVFDIKNGKYLNTEDAKLITSTIGLKWVPYVTEIEVTDEVTVDSLLALAEGKSVLNSKQEREGLVWRTTTEMELHRVGRVSFKTISNKFLLSGGE
jgi:RNA ligase (TIGR02306 family)